MNLGSKYGNKTFYNIYRPDQNLVVISGGVGQDISFDVEFLRFYPAKIFLVDPTPDAAKHIQDVGKQFGRKSCRSYSEGSRQSADAYDLSHITGESFTFVPSALWNEDSIINFYLPEDTSRDSSGSIHGIHAFYKPKTSPIKVSSITINTLCHKFAIEQIDLLKLDIEGAALEVITQMYHDNIYPKQILLEFDEIHFPSFKSKVRAEKLFRLLDKIGYDLFDRTNCDFVFVKKDTIFHG
jgi:FkbM family methyltransferase